jgi:protein arginine kinase activator
MEFKCDKCDRPARIHLTEISQGQKVEKHLCEQCAAAEGLSLKHSLSLSQMLEEFVLHGGPGQEGADLKCDVCGMTFSEFRQQSLLGCPHDYDAFEQALLPLLERAQGGAAQHAGKVPHRAGGDQKKHSALLRLRAELKNAIAAEDYERAAMLRDQIKELDNT